MTDLSPREKQIVQMLWDGLTLKDIATVLDLSYKTVRNYRLLAGAKLQASTHAGLCRKAHDLGVIE